MLKLHIKVLTHNIDFKDIFEHLKYYTSKWHHYKLNKKEGVTAKLPLNVIINFYDILNELIKRFHFFMAHYKRLQP